MAVDALGTPLPNGVYDPRLGPAASDSGPCPTCALRYLACPGHFGHIELCVPLYHPLLFAKMIELLRIKCLNCHHFKAAPRSIEVFKLKFKLLKYGHYLQALDLDNRLAATVKENRVEEKQGRGEKKSSILSSHEAGVAVDKALKEISDSIESNITSSQCSLSTCEQAYHRQLVKEFFAICKGNKSCPRCGAYSPKIRQDSSNKVFQSPLSATHKRNNEGEGIVLEPALSKVDAEGGDAKGEDDGYESDDTRGEESIKSDLIEPTGATSQNSGRDKFMHNSEVQAQARRTWETDPELCGDVFAVQGNAIFFMQAIPVPPNRFRPPMHLSGMVVEHSQNVHLNNLLKSNELVRYNFAHKNEAIAYKHWIDLQTHLNCFMDSSKDPNINNQAPGIRQLLERKEGVFRKHMMGKRVNYACRSVISPDPYIGTNEIGIPRHFAHTLTYPTPVTDINIEEMRNLVERGPDHWPGARWVEFPDRRVDLSKMDDHKREAVAARLLMYAKKGGRPAIVGRQMQDGDMVLMNRQVRDESYKFAF